jgi:hypothetical protein
MKELLRGESTKSLKAVVLKCPSAERFYTSATTGMGDHEVHKGHVVALEKNSISRGICTMKKLVLANNGVAISWRSGRVITVASLAKFMNSKKIAII